MRRLIYLFSILVVVGVVIGVGYFLRYRTEEPEVPILGQLPTTPTQKAPPATSASPTPSAPGTSTPSALSQSALPQISAEGRKFGVVSQNNILDFFVAADNSVIFVEPSGKIGRVVRGETSLLSSSEIVNLWRASFSYDGKKILAEFGDLYMPQYSVFDTENKSWSPLPSYIKTPAWSPTSYEIAYLAEKSGEDALATLDITNPKAKPREILNLNAKDVFLSWLEPNSILINEKGGAAFAASVFRVDIKNKAIDLLIPPRIGLEVLWSAKAERGLIFVGGRTLRGGELGLVDEKGVLLNRLAFITLPRKCGFYEKAAGQISTSTPPSEEFLACAIPRDREKPTKVPLPDAYEERALYTSDDLYEISLKDGTVREIYKSESSYFDGYNLKIFGKNLFFVNRFDGKLYAVSLE